MKKTISPIWIVPMVAALVSVYLVYQRVRDSGPAITIKFKDGGGLRTGVTPIKYRGVSIGLIDNVELSRDHQFVLATAHLHSADSAVANEGARFWIVRPQVGLGSVTGLSTVLTGPEIHMLPGTGKARTEFVGLENPPTDSNHEGLNITLHGTRLGALKANSPVFYRGIVVGTVEAVRLGADATGVDLEVHIPKAFVPLIHTDTKFWKLGSVDISGGIFRGIKFRIDSLSTLVTGGVELAVPSTQSGRAPVDGASFVLYDAPAKEWLEWSPRIVIGKRQSDSTAEDAAP
jgi:paraquat-inducible protein B